MDWVFSGSNNSLVFLNLNSKVVVEVSEDCTRCNVYFGDALIEVRGDGVFMFLFATGLLRIFEQTKTRLAAESVLKEVVEKLRNLPEHAPVDQIKGIISPLKDYRAPDAYYNEFIRHKLGYERLYQASIFGSLRWVYVREGGEKVTIDC